MENYENVSSFLKTEPRRGGKKKQKKAKIKSKAIIIFMDDKNCEPFEKATINKLTNLV